MSPLGGAGNRWAASAKCRRDRRGGVAGRCWSCDGGKASSCQATASQGACTAPEALPPLEVSASKGHQAASARRRTAALPVADTEAAEAPAATADEGAANKQKAATKAVAASGRPMAHGRPSCVGFAPATLSP